MSHFLWADDLVFSMLYLYRGLSTESMIFARSGGYLWISPKLPSWCSLSQRVKSRGATAFNMVTSSHRRARKERFESIFCLRNLIQLDALSVKAVFQLFNALILPVVACGCQNWLQCTQFAKSLINQHRGKTAVSTKNISNDPPERLHLRFLKWIFKKSSKSAPALLVTATQADILSQSKYI